MLHLICWTWQGDDVIVVVKKFVRLENILQHHHVSLKSRKIISHFNTFQDNEWRRTAATVSYFDNRKSC